MRTPVPPRLRRAFTLVELCVTLATAAALVALSAAGLRTATQAAGKAKLTSNMRQVHAGLLTYVGDNNGLFPATSSNDVGSLSVSGDDSWQALTSPYVGESHPGHWRDAVVVGASVYHDPLDRTVKTGSNPRPTRNIAINGYGNPGQSPIGLSSRPFTSIRYPSRMLALTTGLAAQYGDEYAGGMRIRNIYFPTHAAQLTRVPGWYYCVFVDGHLEVLPEARMVQEAALSGQSVFFDPSGNNGGK